MSDTTTNATFAAGCFWGVEARFREVQGVTDAAVGYMGGSTENPTYEAVCTDTTGHAEVVNVQFNPEAVSYEALLDVFFSIHDPTQVNRQGPDVGTQYRTAIFAHSQEQRDQATKKIEALNHSGKFNAPIATTIEPAAAFHRAEEYHQQYLAKRGINSCAI